MHHETMTYLSVFSVRQISRQGWGLSGCCMIFCHATCLWYMPRFTLQNIWQQFLCKIFLIPVLCTCLIVIAYLILGMHFGPIRAALIQVVI